VKRKITIMLVAGVVLVVFMFAMSPGWTQEIPPDQGGGPETGCEGIQNANIVQGDQADPSSSDLVGDAHLCKTDLPFNPYSPGSSGGHPQS
jgi:hypothetical protein